MRCSGSTGLQEITHAMLWSMVGNIGAYVLVSLMTHQSVAERAQAARFVDVLRHEGDGLGGHLWKGTATVADLQVLLRRFLGVERADAALAEYARSGEASRTCNRCRPMRRSCNSRRRRSPARSAARRHGS